MKFITIKTILSLLFIGIVLSNTAMRKTKTRSKDEGNGSWTNGFNCPQVFIQQENGQYVNQGAAKIMGPKIEAPTTNTEKLGLNFQFEAVPPATSLIVKVGTKVDDKTYYIPYRYFQGDMAYNNPVRDFKTLISSFVTDNKSKYILKINLPYKTFGWFISDEESTKIQSHINNHSIVAKGNISSSKLIIGSNSENFISVNALLKAASTKKADLDAALLAQKNSIAKLSADLTANTQQITTLRETYRQKQLNLQTAAKKLQAANEAVSTTASSLNNIELQRQNVPASPADALKAAKAKLDEVVALTNTNYDHLKKEVSTHVADFDKSKAGLAAGDQTAFENGLKSSYPN